MFSTGKTHVHTGSCNHAEANPLSTSSFCQPITFSVNIPKTTPVPLSLTNVQIAKLFKQTVPTNK